MDSQENIVITEEPRLRNPYLLCGMSGWVDGGEAATGSIRYLVSKLEAKKFAEIPIDKFHISQVAGQLSLRPQIKIEDGILKEHHFPENQFFYWTNITADNDLVLFLGTEPNLNWKEYSDAVLGLVDRFAISRIYLLGGVLDKVPYTKEPKVSCLCSSNELKDEMQKYGMEPINYEGPGRWGTSLLYTCQKKRYEMVCPTVAVSYYPEFNVIISRNPKAIRAMLIRLRDLLHIKLDLSDLDREGEELEAKLEFMASHNPKFRAYIEQLEKDFVEVKYEQPLDISASEAVHIAEQFLRDRKNS